MSNETKFTKGEWEVINNNESYLIRSADTGFGVCETVLHEEADKHNAQLIKTAPKLYVEIERLINRGVELLNVDCIDDEEDGATIHANFNDELIKASKLLAEARGELK